MNILFRCDSSFSIGLGHLMRDLVLAQEFKNSNITFASQDLDGNMNHKILQSGYKLEVLKSDSLDELILLIKKLDIDMVVIDSYKIDYEFEKALKVQTDVKIFVLDDTYERHFCDILLNHNISADINRYRDLVPKDCEIRCGSKYTLLRDEFKIEKTKGKNLSNDKIALFMGIGGSDYSNINIKILKVLEQFENLKINLVTTTANLNLDELKSYTKDKSNIELHINTDKIASLMNQSHFAIITPSVTLNEIYYLDTPFIAIKTAENQNDIYEYLLKNGFPVLECFDEERLQQSLKEFKILHTGQ